MLRPYQKDICNRTITSLKEKKKTLLVAPTGCGKTIIASHVVEKASYKMISIFLTDRKEIIEQTSRAFSRHLINHSIINTETKYVPKCNVYIGMVETFWRRLSAGWFDNINIGLIVCDEAHMGNFSKIIKHFKDKETLILGLTATPIGAKEKLRSLYNDLILAPSVPWFIENKYLVPSVDFGQSDILDLKIQNGEFTEASQKAEFDRLSLDEKMIRLWHKHSHERKTICFNIDIEHNNRVKELFHKYDLNAECVDSECKNRDEIIEAFKKGYIQILCNVGITTKGFDDPPTSCIILNRAINSVALYYQMVGRGARPFNNKEDFHVIDIGNNIFRHGSYNEGIDWEYLFYNDDKKTTLKTNLRLCPTCYAYISNIYIPKCHVCGSIVTSKTLLSLESQMPEELKEKDVYSMTFKELQLYGKLKGYKGNWAWVMSQKIKERNRFNNLFK